MKPDNILFVNGNWKIADLGLVDGRQLDYEILDYNIVGPRGWLSPEAMNKYLTENKSFKYKFDILIDSQSDIFQLGKLFWYIFQHNAPIGSVKMSDFKNEFSEIYPILKTMLNHNKREDIKVSMKLYLCLKNRKKTFAKLLSLITSFSLTI
ncbi:MAG: protein kinase [Bacteroidetes bacterium]|nr:protein kinase [Bacteroidota bacterium]